MPTFTRTLSPRFKQAESDEIVKAAKLKEMTPTAFVKEAALLCAAATIANHEASEKTSKAS